MSLVEQALSYVRAISPYQPGKPMTELARDMGIPVESILKLASNENPLGMSPKAQVAVAAAISGIARYPDPFELIAKLAGMPVPPATAGGAGAAGGRRRQQHRANGRRAHAPDYRHALMKVFGRLHQDDAGKGRPQARTDRLPAGADVERKLLGPFPLVLRVQAPFDAAALLRIELHPVGRAGRQVHVAQAGAEALQGLPLIVSHIKYSLLAGEPPQQAIRRELEAANDLGLRIVMPQQGDRYRF